MHDFQEQCQISSCDRVVVIIYFKTMYNKTIIIRFGFCDIRNNQGLGIKVLSASAFSWDDNNYLDLDYSRYHKNLIQ